HLFQQLDGERIDRSLGMAARAESPKTAFPPVIDQAFGEDAARRVAGTKKEHVVSSWLHVLHPDLQSLRHDTGALRAQQAELLALLHGRRRTGAIDDPISEMLEERPGRLRQKDQLGQTV